jgi:sodium-dependent dicarboxylate transporter 2/3/5
MASIMVPLMAITSVSMGINPMLLMIAAALASSLGFILPVGTPPNAIAYGTGYISTREMARAGFALNIIGCILVTLFMTLIVPMVLGISHEIPAWAVLPGK